MQHQAQLAEKRRQHEARAAERARAAALKQVVQAERQSERARTQAARASAAEQKAAEREAARLHQEAMLAEAESRNANLAVTYGEIDSLLAATLDVDDYVDLEQLRQLAEHPPFGRPDLERPTPLPAPIAAPPQPVYQAPESAPRGLGAVFGGKKRHGHVVAQAQAAHAAALEAWQTHIQLIPEEQRRQREAYDQAERTRNAQLQEARQSYEHECRQREDAVAQINRDLDELIRGLAYNTEDAVQEYVAIVLSNSVYPDSFPVEHQFRFDSTLRELSLTVRAPGPQELPDVKAYKYIKSSDEVTSTALSQKEQRERYNSAVAQVALRTLHEVFEADRAARIHTIALKVLTETIDEATGLSKETPLVAVAADRESFTTFDLANILPTATLKHMNAQVSTNPFELVPIDTSKGVRG